MKPDGKGNVYLFNADTIKKLNSVGEVEWRRNYQGTPMYDSSGIFIGTYVFSNDTVSRYDSFGNNLWTISSPDFLSAKQTFDESSNLFFIKSISTSNTAFAGKLTKVSMNGSISFRTTFLSDNIYTNYDDYHGSTIWASIIDNQRRRLYALLWVDAEKKNKYYADFYVVRFDIQTGNIILNPKSQKIYTKLPLGTHNNNDGGFGLNPSGDKFFTVNNERYVISATGHNEKFSKNGHAYLSSWCIFYTDSLGKTKSKKLKGKGLITDRDEGYITQYSSNALFDILVDNAGNYYLFGQMNSNKVYNNNSDAYCDDILLKMNISKNKLVWKNIIVPLSQCRYPRPFSMAYDNLRNILITRTGYASYTLFIYDTSGNKSAINFPDEIIALQQNATKENGFLYLTMKNDSVSYLAKYSLPVSKFATDFINQNREETFALQQNYPNPFNPKTTLSFVIGNSSLVTLKIYNVLGQEVATLLNNEAMEEGLHEIQFDASNLTSGVYFYRLDVAQRGSLRYSETKKLVLMK
jgi:hypothetical protein